MVKAGDRHGYACPRVPRTKIGVVEVAVMSEILGFLFFREYQVGDKSVPAPCMVPVWMKGGYRILVKISIDR